MTFVLLCSTGQPIVSKNPYDVFMEEAGRQVWPDKYDVTQKNTFQNLHNAVINFLQEKELGWSKVNILFGWKAFVTAL